MKSFNENHVPDYNRFLSLFNPLFIGFFAIIPIRQNVEKSIINLFFIETNSVHFRRTEGLFNNQKFLTRNMNQPFFLTSQ